MNDDRRELLEMQQEITVLRQRAVEGDIDGMDAVHEIEKLVTKTLSEQSDFSDLE